MFGTRGRTGTFVRTRKVVHHVNHLAGGPSVGVRYSGLKVPMYDGMKMGFWVHHEVWWKVPV